MALTPPPYPSSLLPFSVFSPPRSPPVRASGRVGQLLLFGRFFVVFGVFEIVYTRYF